MCLILSYLRSYSRHIVFFLNRVSRTDNKSRPNANAEDIRATHLDTQAIQQNIREPEMGHLLMQDIRVSTFVGLCGVEFHLQAPKTF